MATRTEFISVIIPVRNDLNTTSGTADHSRQCISYNIMSYINVLILSYKNRQGQI